MKKEPISFRYDIQPLGSVTIEERIKDTGYIEEFRIRFYPGQERALKVRPFVEHKGSRQEELVTYPSGTEPFFSGDDDYFVYPSFIGVEYDDMLKVYAENTSDLYVYTLVIDVIVNYTFDESNVKNV